MYASTLESLANLDREIARLEQDLLALKRRRNTELPVSRLPPELLSKIFFLALRYMDVDYSKMRPQWTKMSICAVSHHWREIAFNAPELWMEIQIQANTKVQYLDLALKQVAENQAVYIDGWHVTSNGGFGARRILEAGKRWQVKRAVLNASAETIHRIFDGLDLKSEGTEALELTCLDWMGKLSCSDALAGAFPHIRRLFLMGWEVPRASELLKFSALADFTLHRISVMTPEDLQEIFLFLKLARHLTDFNLDIPSTEHHFPNGPWPTLPRLGKVKALSISSRDNQITSILLGALYLSADVERMTVVFGSHTGSTSAEVSQQAASTLNLALRHTTAPRSLLVTSTIGDDGDERGFEYIGFGAQWDGKRTLGIFMVVPGASFRDVGLSQTLYSLPFTNPEDWLLSRLESIEVVHYPSFPFWEAIAGIPTLQKISVRAWQRNDCFTRALQGDGLPDGSPQPGTTTPFPALNSIDVIFTARSLNTMFKNGYAQDLASALRTRAARGGDSIPGPGQIDTLHFYCGASELGIHEDTHTLLLSVALDVRASVSTTPANFEFCRDSDAMDTYW
ncbi:hypothetical protein DFP72DRAFT_908273 [Ephemerocybe angulata]|uniref:F-box domain-containing protein n=1 Tax=Ephemerocybe angulata TaxID=980116 RepID=A0A8H6M400_9AGAR|nr:hypothetical protein DFP72DRAFT_908273 [Tulosesus angulatus]